MRIALHTRIHAPPARDRTYEHGRPAMNIVDAHHHVWDLAVRDQPWIAGAPMAPIRRSFGVDDLRPSAHAAGVTATVLVQTVTVAAETPEMLALAAADPLVAGVVGWTDLTSPEISGELARLAAGPGGRHLVGIRHQVQGEPDPDWLRRPDVIRGLRAVAAAGLCYDLVVLPHQIAAATYAATEVPGLTLILDHAGKPPIGSGELDAWRAAIGAFAARPNTACKLSGLVTEAPAGARARRVLAGRRRHLRGVRPAARYVRLGLAGLPAGARLRRRGRASGIAGRQPVGRGTERGVQLHRGPAVRDRRTSAGTRDGRTTSIRRQAVALTDEAITKIKEMITSGRLRPGEKLPREADLAAELGLSRNSLREAVKALSMINVLDVRQGDGTYATSLSPSLLLEALSFIVDFHRDDTVLEFLEVRRILEPAATALAALRMSAEDKEGARRDTRIRRRELADRGFRRLRPRIPPQDRARRGQLRARLAGRQHVACPRGEPGSGAA